MNLSVVIITKNEEHNIRRCIESCLTLGAEIIVLDSESTDRTVSISKGLGALVHIVKWRGYGATKNYGAELAQYDWILSLDADEALDTSLQKILLESFDPTSSLFGYWLYRSFIFNDKQLFYGALKNERRLRLYNKNKMQWNLSEVHEDLIPKEEILHPAFGEFQGSLLHYSYKDLEDMRSRLDHYAKLSAKKLTGKSTTYLNLKKLFAPSFSFIKNYILRKGFLDGTNGLIFAREQADYVRKKYQYALKEIKE